MSSEPTRAVYVRMPDRLAEKLDRVAERLGASKRDLLTALVDDHLDLDGDNLVLRPHVRRTSARTGVTDVQEVLTVEEAAALLRVNAADVATSIAAGDLTARRVGEQWRLSRSGVLAWLRGDGPTGVSARRP